MTAASTALVWIHNADDPRVIHAQNDRTCDLCLAPKTKPCTNTINPDEPLAGRVIHYARLVDRRREKKADE
jgi:hypothetical protein